MDEDVEIEMMVSHIRTIAEEYLTKFWGERCPDFEESCLVCQKWKALDLLTDTLR